MRKSHSLTATDIFEYPADVLGICGNYRIYIYYIEGSQNIHRYSRNIMSITDYLMYYMLQVNFENLSLFFIR